MNINDFKMMAPMKYYNPVMPKIGTSAYDKRIDMINNKNNEYVATTKHDGDFAMLIHYSKGHNLIRSRSISKVTNEYGDYTEKLPQIVKDMDMFPDETVILAEICWDEPNTDSNKVGTILRCSAEKAVERQKDKALSAIEFDVLMYAGEDLTSIPYIDRLNKLIASDVCNEKRYIYHTDIFTEGNFQDIADNVIYNGGEGLVIQLKTNKYLYGTRTAWKSLKLKKATPTMELKVVGALEPNKLYCGDYLENWAYWSNDMKNADKTQQNVAVTKPYFMGWKNGVAVDYNGVVVNVTSGLSDDDREWLSTEEAKNAIEKGQVIAEVKAMEENALKSLRHPILVKLRYLDN